MKFQSCSPRYENVCVSSGAADKRTICSLGLLRPLAFMVSLDSALNCAAYVLSILSK